MTLGCAEPPTSKAAAGGEGKGCRSSVPGWGTSLAGMLSGITCISLEVFRGDHDHEPNGTLVSEHLVGPPADGAHALHSGDAIVGDEDLGGQGHGASG